MTAVRSDKRDLINAENSDESYKPNEEGLYEPELADVMRISWWREQYGKVVKCIVPWLGSLPVHGYRVVFMLRDPEEIRQSFRAAAGLTARPRTLPTIEHVDEAVREGQLLVANRKDVESIVTLRYREDLLTDPRRCMDLLAENGWPIDPAKASAVIDRQRCRFKRENLVEGL